MSSPTDSVGRLIRKGVEGLVSSTSFETWLANERNLGKDDIVAFNNSFVFRDRVKTTKSSDYLCVPTSDSGALNLRLLGVGTPPGFNADFKRFSAKSQNLLDLQPLPGAVEEQIARLGRLVFILIGMVDEGVQTSVPISHGLLSELRFDPHARVLAGIEDAHVVITQSLHDPEGVWSDLQRVAISEGIVDDQLPSNLKAPFADAFERLQQEAVALVRLPAKAAGSKQGRVLGHLVDAIGRQTTAYKSALKQYEEAPERRPQALTDILRIAYNFAGDGSKLIDLVVSVCDLKPVLLWCTIREHFILAEAFRNLPWVESKKKPSLDRYEETIARARNRSFHDLIPFDRSMEVDLTDVHLQARRLRLFSPHSRRGANMLEYEDQELVEVLTQFTRAPETSVDLAFWRRNAEVMRALQRLLDATSTALVTLRRSTV